MNFVTIFSFLLIISILLSIFDFPKLQPDYSYIDCNSILIKNLNIEKGLINFHIKISETFENPPENVFSFLNVNISSNNKNYILSDYYDFAKSYKINGSDYTFSVFHQIGGQNHVQVKCKDHVIFNENITVSDEIILSNFEEIPKDDLPFFNQYLQMKPNSTIIINDTFYKNIYFRNKQFYALIPQKSVSYFHDIAIGSKSFKLSSITQRRRKNHIVDGATFLFDGYDDETWKQILFQIAPLLNSLKDQDISINIFTSKCDPSYEEKLHYILFPECLDNINMAMFETLIIKQFDYHVNYLDNSQIINALDQDFSIFRYLQKNKPSNKNKIAISSYLKDKYDLIQDNYPHIEIIEINENMTFNEMMSALNDAFLLIGTKIEELIGAVFLPTDSIVIDLQSYRNFCSDWAHRLCNQLEIIYTSIDRDCKCDNFACSSLINWDIPIKIPNDELLSIISETLRE